MASEKALAANRANSGESKLSGSWVKKYNSRKPPAIQGFIRAAQACTRV
ncbi:MAG: hypothetical protein RL742_442 [Bacteroidota bacterium]